MRMKAFLFRPEDLRFPARISSLSKFVQWLILAVLVYEVVSDNNSLDSLPFSSRHYSALPVPGTAELRFWRHPAYPTHPAGQRLLPPTSFSSKYLFFYIFTLSSLKAYPFPAYLSAYLSVDLPVC